MIDERNEGAGRGREGSGRPGDGAGRRDDVGRTNVYPMSSGERPSGDAEARIPGELGQGERGVEGREDAGGSPPTMRDGQVVGGLTAGAGGEPTIDIHDDEVDPRFTRAEGKLPGQDRDERGPTT